jgi:hypothetical protein
MEGEKTAIIVRMVAEPRRTANGASERAIRAYEKPRTFTLFRVSLSQHGTTQNTDDGKDQELDVILCTLAEMLHTGPDQLVLEHKGTRLMSMRLTPNSLKWSDRTELRECLATHFGFFATRRAHGWRYVSEGYDTEYYARLLEERREHWQLLTSGLQSTGPAAGGDVGAGVGAAASNSTYSPGAGGGAEAADTPSGAKTSVKLILRGRDGEETKRTIPLSTTAKALVAFFCKSWGKSKEESLKYRLELDGEGVAGDTLLGQLDLEDGDMVDVVKIG